MVSLVNRTKRPSSSNPFAMEPPVSPAAPTNSTLVFDIMAGVVNVVNWRGQRIDDLSGEKARGRGEGGWWDVQKG